VVVLLALLGLNACAGLLDDETEPPAVSLAGLSFAEPGLFEQELTISLRLRNPNEFEIPVDTLSFALDVNGATLANGRSRRDFILPSLGEVVVPVSVLVPTNDLIERVVAIGTGRRLDYRLVGEADLGGWLPRAIPFSREGKLALPDIPGLENFGLDGREPDGLRPGPPKARPTDAS
jgi:LEA14-like dessication related protein